jgi:hypothetical protein
MTPVTSAPVAIDVVFGKPAIYGKRFDRTVGMGREPARKWSDPSINTQLMENAIREQLYASWMSN